MDATYDRWYCTHEDLKGLDAARARDLIIDCFYQAQHETLLRHKAALGMAPDEASIRMDAEGSVRNAFKRTGGDYRNPTKESLANVVMSLAATASAMGTPDDIIEHHKKQIGIVLAGLPG